MKKIFLLFVSMVTFILSGTGEIKDINDTLQKNKSGINSQHDLQ
jgi:hypothetical protein